jgi:hypothetical protein
LEPRLSLWLYKSSRDIFRGNKAILFRRFREGLYLSSRHRIKTDRGNKSHSPNPKLKAQRSSETLQLTYHMTRWHIKQDSNLILIFNVIRSSNLLHSLNVNWRTPWSRSDTEEFPQVLRHQNSIEVFTIVLHSSPFWAKYAYSSTLALYMQVAIIIPTMPRFPNRLFLSELPTNILHRFLFSPTCATQITHVCYTNYPRVLHKLPTCATQITHVCYTNHPRVLHKSPTPVSSVQSYQTHDGLHVSFLPDTSYFILIIVFNFKFNTRWG